jgi:phage FluMu protein Com
MKWCPKCKELKEQVNRVFSMVATWDDEEDDYRYDSQAEYEAELIDKCPECGEDLEEMPHAKGAEDNKAV